MRADGVITPEESAEVAAALKKLTARRSVPFSVTLRLVLMMFLQMMTFPVWFNTVVPYIRTLPGGEKWVPLCGAYLTTNATAIAGLLLVVTCLLMPTWSLVSAIAMNHASPASFPYIRVFGTLGWAAAALTGCHALDFGGILIHGLIFGSIVVNVQMHIAEKVPDDIRNQAQGLVMILTSGVGDFLSIAVFYPVLSFCSRTTADGHILHNWSVPFLVSFGIALLSMFLLLVFYREGRKAAK